MCSIQRVNKVGWECRSLLDAINGGGCGGIGNVNRLQGRHDLLTLRLAIRLHNRQSQRRRPHYRRHLLLPYAGLHRICLGIGALGFEDLGETFFGNTFSDEFGAEVQPVLDAFGTCEKVTDAVKDILCEVCRSCPTVFFRYVPPIFQLPLDLLASADIGNAVHGRHDLQQKPSIDIKELEQSKTWRTHRLLDHFARYFSQQELCNLLAIVDVSLYDLFDHVGNIGIHVRRPVGDCQVDLCSTFAITSEGCVMLQTITCTVLVDGMRRHVCMRVFRLKSSVKLRAGSKTLPWIVCLGPPAPTLSRNSEKIVEARRLTNIQRILGTVVYIIKVVHHKGHAFVETPLVKPVQVGKMNL